MKFINLTNELQPKGKLTNESNSFNFYFPDVNKPYETFRGELRSVKYYIKVTIMTTFKNYEFEQEFAVIRLDSPDILKQDNEPIKFEVGYETYLHLLLVLDSKNYGLKDNVKGTFTIKKDNFKMKFLEIQIIRKESVNRIGVDPDTKVVGNYKIMNDGWLENEAMPISFSLKEYDLTPTYKNVNDRFSVEYFINFIFIDAKEQRFFKQHEIFLFRIDKN